MYKMAIQAVLFSVMALGFIVTRSDALRVGGQTGDITQIAAAAAPMSLDELGLSQLSGKASGSAGGMDYTQVGQPKWYENLDPRQLWQGQSKTIRLNPKTVKAPDTPVEGDLDAQLAAQNLDNAPIAVVQLK